ncbi:LysR family transcriptional regulator [Variovorax sp. CYS-02]|uniref:LysR family transcriptional regulator n=2 Tax=Variovorax terrae TaxID=2923278 RepID=A0A9X1VT13_9BURK|nr:LysR family transcriptional regulator [Variovorax terrae]MCJ0763366.1 LysR family transcriptional regulator [Variovorax terrae]
MNFSWLEDFLALAASGNFSRAAEERHMTQPAFSRRVRALEEWVGTELFDRTSQPATLTPAGEWFRTSAHDLLARVARVPGEARAVAEAHSTTLRFAATHALSFTFMPGWLRALEQRTRVGPVSLVSDVLQRCEAMLLHSQVQFVLCHAHPQAPGELQAQDYPSVCVGNDVLVPVSAPGADGAARHSLSPASASAPVPILSYSPESGIGQILREVRGPALAHSATHNVFTAHLASVLRTMALDGRGIAWLPQTLIADDLASGRLVEAAPDGRIAVELRLFRDRAPLGQAGEEFWTAVCAG